MLRLSLPLVKNRIPLKISTSTRFLSVSILVDKKNPGKLVKHVVAVTKALFVWSYYDDILRVNSLPTIKPRSSGSTSCQV